MIKKYVTNYSNDEIRVVAVIRETDKCVFLKASDSWKNNERKELKTTDNGCYFNEFQDAKAYLLSMANNRVSRAENNFVRECDKRKKIESILEL